MPMMDNAGRRRRLEFVSLDLKLTLLIEVESRAINMRINLLSLTQRYCSPLSARCISAPGGDLNTEPGDYETV